MIKTASVFGLRNAAEIERKVFLRNATPRTKDRKKSLLYASVILHR